MSAFFKQFFEYIPKKNYNFLLSNHNNSNEISNTNNIISKSYTTKQSTINNYKTNKKSTPVFYNLNSNLEYINKKYNLPINSDISIRHFVFTANCKQFKCFLLYINGMINSNSLNNFVISPLMTQNKKNSNYSTNVVSQFYKNNIKIKKLKKFNLANYVENFLITQNALEKINNFEEIFEKVNSGNCALFIETLNIAFCLDIKGFKERSISKPENEVVIKGSHEAFVENLTTNTSMIRKFTNNENLIIENISIGSITKTNCCICYMKNITNDALLTEIKYRLSSLKVDYILSSGQLEQLISDPNYLGIPKIISTERPDNAVQNLLDGRIIIVVNGSPLVLILPAVITDFITSPEDRNLKSIFANFLRIIRIIAIFFALLLPRLLCFYYKFSFRNYSNRTTLFNNFFKRRCPISNNF